VKLPHLTPVAKGQLWGLLVGFSLAVLAQQRLGLSLAILVIGGLAAWVASERLLAPRLLGTDTKTVALAVLSGIAFPMIGLAAAWLLDAMRP
jgi:hypothetical protein